MATDDPTRQQADSIEAASRPQSVEVSAGDGMAVASELIRARTERGMSQTQLAEASGLSRSAIKAYESGRNMPGSRELRALCIALKVTPNKLLFGSEAPALEAGDAEEIDAVFRSDPEEQATARARLAVLSSLLAEDEYRSLLLLARSLAVARHGPDKVHNAIVGADLFVGVVRAMGEEAAQAARSGAAVNPERAGERLEQFLQRQGHHPEPQPVKATAVKDTKKAS